ncbi:MAG: hypothetical protein PHW69_10105 [Elusimicrobiaceae bacterium]|nr:hypothetical protein [Elusimicrobiaceae bacterium]
MPPLALTVLFVNTAREYHLQTLVPFLALTAVVTGRIYFEKLKARFPELTWRSRFEEGLKSSDPAVNKYTRALALCAFCAAINAAALVYDYGCALRVSLGYAPRYLFGRSARIDERAARLVDLLAELPHKKLSTMAQYQALFLDPVLSVSNPLVEDLSISGNSGGYAGMHLLTASLLASPPDIYIGKRFSDGASYELGFLGRFLRGRYIQLADFTGADSNYVPLRWRFAGADGVKNREFDDLYYSSAAFARNFTPVKAINPGMATLTACGAREYRLDLAPLLPENSGFLIAEVRFPAGGVRSASLSSGRNSVRLGRRPLSPDRIYCAFRAEDGAVLKLFSSSPATPLAITFFARR